MAKNRIVILSDIHIGTNTPTNWYQADVHEPYLLAVLQHVIDQKDSIQELIILGDLADLWTYLPTTTPPPFFDPEPPNSIMFQNRGVFGDPIKGILGQLGWAVVALQGNVSFLHGNHDMTVTQAELDRIPTGSNGPQITLQPDIYFPLGTDNADIVCTHGHEFSMLCAPDLEAANTISPLPLGYYVTRTGAYLAAQQLTPDQPNVAYLPNTGEPTGIDITYEDYLRILGDLFRYSLGGSITALVHDETNYGWTDPIVMPDGSVTTLNDAFYNFYDLLDTWEEKIGPDGEPLGYTGALEALLYPDVYNDLSSYAQGMAAAYNSKIVVMGHTHAPLDGMNTQETARERTARINRARLQLHQPANGDAPFIYANSGFNCPSIPDMETADPKRPTFVEIEITDTAYNVTVMEVAKTGNTYTVEPDPDIPTVSISKS